MLIWSYMLPSVPHEIPVGQPEAPDTVVVCAPMLRHALEPWLEYRTAQGHSVLVVTECESAPQIRSAIRGAAQRGRLRHVLIVGDVQPAAADVGLHAATYLAQARINTRWGSETHIATDNWFADLDDDICPDLAIGRLTADSPEQLSAIIQKIIRYEQSSSGGIWRRRVNLVAGVGGFGMLADAVLEASTRSFISQGIPEGYKTSMTYASWRSPYCPDPRAFRQQAIERLNEGCLCWVYIGHGHREGLDWVRVPLGVAPILNLDDVQQVACVPGPPIALFLSCYGAAFDGAEDCLAERLLARPEGPVAVIGGSRVTMPYGMAVLSQGLMQQMFRDRPATVGQLLMEAKRQTLASPQDNPQRPWLDALARALSPNADDLDGELREHVLMFQLLGDPLTRMAHAEQVEIDVPRSVSSGEQFAITCRTDVAGQCTVELACRRGRLTFKPESRLQFDGTHEGMEELTRVYRRANDDRFASRQFMCTTGEFATTLSVPPDAHGPCAVRVFVQGAKTCALGAAALYVSRPQMSEQEQDSSSATRQAGSITPTASP
jgi:hypothetical protein